MPQLYWHPDGGYGFYCRPSLSSVRDFPVGWMDRTSMLLLKLHGSMNWRPLRGALAPYRIDEILHEENWLDDPELNRLRQDVASEILAHLEPEPFIVPPVLMKSILTEQPMLR